MSSATATMLKTIATFTNPGNSRESAIGRGAVRRYQASNHTNKIANPSTVLTCCRIVIGLMG